MCRKIQLLFQRNNKNMQRVTGHTASCQHRNVLYRLASTFNCFTRNIDCFRVDKIPVSKSEMSRTYLTYCHWSISMSEMCRKCLLFHLKETKTLTKSGLNVHRIRKPLPVVSLPILLIWIPQPPCIQNNKHKL